jgi:Glycosyl transferase family 2
MSETLHNETPAQLDLVATGSGDRVDGTSVGLSVCIPCYSAPAAMLQESVDSAAAQLPPGAELLILPNGQRAIETVQHVTLPARTRVVPSDEVLDLVTNWNRCLDEAAGSLIHILHEDDAVAPGFYRVVFEAARRFPGAALYATASQSFDLPPRSEDDLVAEPELLAGIDAARFLLLDTRHSCGNVVFTRRALDASGGFLPEFKYCCDEEAYLRLAASGGIGFHPARLYRNRTHTGQNRYADWLRTEWVPTYVGSRVEGARALGSHAVAIAMRSSEERVASVAITLASSGYRAESIEQLERLEAFIHPRRSRRITVAKVVCRSRTALTVMRARRRLMAGRTG